MDFENIRGNVFKGIIALIVLIISISAGWDTLMYISLVYLISDIINRNSESKHNVDNRRLTWINIYLNNL